MLDVYNENPLMQEVMEESLGLGGALTSSKLLDAAGNVLTTAEGLDALYNGDYKSALVEFTDLGVSIFGGAAGGALTTVKAVGDLSKAAVEQGIKAWKDHELEKAYKAYTEVAKKGTYGYNLNKGDWETLVIQMGGYYVRLVSEQKEAYRRLIGVDKLSAEDAKRIEEQVDKNLRKQFDDRITKETAIKEKKDEYQEIISAFKERDLLERGTLYFDKTMSVDRRLTSLFAIRQMILDSVDGDISVFGNEKDREFFLSGAIVQWIACGSDRAKFYDWMREKGYLKEKKGTGEGYWQLVRSFENDYETSIISDAYTETWSGGSGSYTYNCKFTGHHSYWGSTHDDCHGEYVNNTGTISTPNERYAGGELVKLNLSMKADTSSNICLHLGAWMAACITPVNKDDPFLNYGTDTYFQNVDDENAKGDVGSNKNDTNTGYYGRSVTTGATMPSGYEDGDKVYILIRFSGGNNTIMTAYEYEWHS